MSKSRRGGKYQTVNNKVKPEKHQNTYVFDGKTRTGNPVKGIVIQASTMEEARLIAKQDGYIIKSGTLHRRK